MCAARSLRAAAAAGLRKVGQLQHLNALGQAIHLLQSEGQNERQTGVINLFLNTAVQAYPDDLDPILIGLHVNEKELIADSQQHGDDHQDL